MRAGYYVKLLFFRDCESLLRGGPRSLQKDRLRDRAIWWQIRQLSGTFRELDASVAGFQVQFCSESLVGGVRRHVESFGRLRFRVSITGLQEQIRSACEHLRHLPCFRFRFLVRSWNAVFDSGSDWSFYRFFSSLDRSEQFSFHSGFSLRTLKCRDSHHRHRHSPWRSRGWTPLTLR
jgi:hypothetical protein